MGGIKIGYSSEDEKKYAVELDAEGRAFVNVPWEAGDVESVKVYTEVGQLPDDAVVGSLGIVRTEQEMKSAFRRSIIISGGQPTYKKEDIKDISSTFDLNLETISNELPVYPTSGDLGVFKSGISVVLENKDGGEIIQRKFTVSIENSESALVFEGGNGYRLEIARRPNVPGDRWNITDQNWKTEIESYMASLGKRWGLAYFQSSTTAISSNVLQKDYPSLYNWINHVFNLKYNDDTLYRVNNDGLWVKDGYIYKNIDDLPNDANVGSLGIVRTEQNMKSAFLGNATLPNPSLYKKCDIKDISSTFGLNLKSSLAPYVKHIPSITVVLASKDNDNSNKVYFFITTEDVDSIAYCILTIKDSDGDNGLVLARRKDVIDEEWQITPDWESQIENYIKNLGRRWGLVYFQYSMNVYGSDYLQNNYQYLYNWLDTLFNLKYIDDTLYRVNNDGLWVENDYVGIKKQTYSGGNMYPNKLYHATTNLEDIILNIPNDEYVYEYLLEFDNSYGAENKYIHLPSNHVWSYYKHLPMADDIDKLSIENFMFIDSNSQVLHLRYGHKVRIHFMDGIATITSAV